MANMAVSANPTNYLRRMKSKRKKEMGVKPPSKGGNPMLKPMLKGPMNRDVMKNYVTGRKRKKQTYRGGV